MKTVTQKVGVFCIALTLVASSTLLTNCKKEKDEPKVEEPVPAPPTNTEKLTGKNFRMTAFTIDPAIGGISNLYAQFQDCDKDDLIRFETNGVFKDDEGATKCSTGSPQTTNGTWSWNTNETIISVTESGQTTSMTVLVNDGTTLKVSFVEPDNGVNYTYTMTYVKQ